MLGTDQVGGSGHSVLGSWSRDLTRVVEGSQVLVNNMS
jgi:hypothetical protein